jgi:hypothetical protein
LLQQKYDIEEMLRGLDEVQQLCRETLGKKRKIAR